MSGPKKPCIVARCERLTILQICDRHFGDYLTSPEAARVEALSVPINGATPRDWGVGETAKADFVRRVSLENANGGLGLLPSETEG
jgi:hypothetical protein